MKKINLILLGFLLFLLPSCDVIGGIFEAGFYTAIIVVVIVIVLIIWLVSRFRK